MESPESHTVFVSSLFQQKTCADEDTSDFSSIIDHWKSHNHEDDVGSKWKISTFTHDKEEQDELLR